MDAIEVGIAVSDSGVVKGVDAIQRHCVFIQRKV